MLCCFFGQSFDIESVGGKRSEGRRLISEVGYKGRGEGVHDREEGGGVEGARLGTAGAEVRCQRRKTVVQGRFLVLLGH